MSDALTSEQCSICEVPYLNGEQQCNCNAGKLQALTSNERLARAAAKIESTLKHVAGAPRIQLDEEDWRAVLDACRARSSAVETLAELKAGDEVVLNFTSSLVKSRTGWKIDRIDRTEYFFVSDSTGSMLTLLRGQFTVKTSPEEPTAVAIKRHSRDCDCTACHYSKKFPQVKPHHATCGCFECAPEKATAPHAPIGSGQTGVCPHGVWLERKCTQCSPLNGEAPL